MTIWLLAVLLLAALAALGSRQGAIRVLLSFFGIVIGGLLAGPLGHLFKPLLVAAGTNNPVWLAFLPPCIGFLLVLTIFKVVGYVLNEKVEKYFKNQPSEVQLALWNRLNHRLGLALGLFNGAAYLVLICASVYLLSYWTVQMETPETDSKTVQILNRMGKDLQATGMTRVAGAVNRMPPSYFQAADVAGFIYQNPLAEARLSRYPAIIGLSEQPQFQDLANDTAFTEMRMKHASLMEVINYPKVQAIIQDPKMVSTITNALLPNLTDLQNFLLNGKSQNFTEEILGRWDFDVPSTMMLFRKAHPNMPAAEVQKYRASFKANFVRMTFVAAPNDFAVLKNYPHVNRGNPPTLEMQNCQGQWNGGGGTYTVTLSIEGKDQQLSGEIRGDRLALNSPDLNLAFVRED